MPKRVDQEQGQVVIHATGDVCGSSQELLESDVFVRVVTQYIGKLHAAHSPVLSALPWEVAADAGRERLLGVLRSLGTATLAATVQAVPGTADLAAPPARQALHEFVEGLYDFWRAFDRFVVLHAAPGATRYDRRPYRAFNATVEALTHLVRSTYRDVCENITGDHPRVYRQVAAGCKVGLIALPQDGCLPAAYQALLGRIPVIRQVWIAPPMVIDPPMNKRSGQFQRVDRNPLAGLTLEPEQWLCYPACVGRW